LFIFAKLYLEFFHTLGFGSTFTIADPGWLEGNISLLEVLAWNFVEVGNLSISTFL
jgi:hypothetical protein